MSEATEQPKPAMSSEARLLEDAGEWRRGLPPGKYYEGMENDYEVYFSPAGQKWHRRRSSNAAMSDCAGGKRES